MRRPPAGTYGDDWPVLDKAPAPRSWWRLAGAGAAALVVALGGGALVGTQREPDPTRWLAATAPTAGTALLNQLGADAPQAAGGRVAAAIDGLLADPGWAVT